MNKKGVDAVVATVLIIMITVSAIAIIWATVIPMIKNSASSATAEKVSLTIETNQGYTVFDPVTNYSFVQIKRGVDNTNLTAINIVFFNGKETKNFTRTDIPSVNSMMVYSLYLQNFGTPIKISVSPIFSDGKEGEVVSEISTIISGTITKEQAEARGQVGNIENGCVVPTETNCVSGYCGGKIIICSCTDLQAMSNNLSGNYLLGRNIDCSGISNFIPIGDSINAFNGTFDGGSKVISNLVINRPTTNYVALFSNTNNSQIKNVGLSNVNIVGANYTGSLISTTIYTNISNCYSSGSVSGYQYVGGLVSVIGSYTRIENSYSSSNVYATSSTSGGLISSASYTTMINSYSTGDVKGAGGVGGLAGSISSSVLSNVSSSSKVNVTYTSGIGSIKNGGLVGTSSLSNISQSFFSGNIYGSGSAGGLGGYFPSSNIISNSYSTGNVFINGSASGFISTLSSNSKIYKCYSTGNVNSTSAYGFIGSLTTSNVSDSYSTGNVNANTTAAGFIGSISTWSNVSNSYSTGNVNANTTAAGFIAAVSTLGNNSVINSFSTGRVNSSLASTQTGGFIGYNGSLIYLTNIKWYNYTTDNAYRCYSGTTPGDVNCTAIPESTGLSYFYDSTKAPMNSWDFTNVWQANSGSYPTLRM